MSYDILQIGNYIYGEQIMNTFKKLLLTTTVLLAATISCSTFAGVMQHFTETVVATGTNTQNQEYVQGFMIHDYIDSPCKMHYSDKLLPFTRNYATNNVDLRVIYKNGPIDCVTVGVHTKHPIKKIDSSCPYDVHPIPRPTGRKGYFYGKEVSHPDSGHIITYYYNFYTNTLSCKPFHF